MLDKHLDGVMTIEQQSFPAPWTKSAFAGHLDHPEFAKYLVALIDGQVVGYIGLFFGGGHGQITNFAVDPLYRRLKIGSRLLLAMLAFSLIRGVDALSLEVRVSNAAASDLYKKFGFVLVGERKGYYQETGEDAYVMCLFDLKDEERQKRFAALRSENDGREDTRD